ncbi:MAG: hypothetical protein EOO99_01605 [Pedobacter sp.]|nr:MAG: hypothetical protein EOO99_01605 [Pedobacter sp.]
MSLLNEFVNSISDPQLAESIQDRIDIIEHKIKFRDPVPVYVASNLLSGDNLLKEMIERAGGILVSEPSASKTIIYMNDGQTISLTMNEIISQVNPSWEAAQLKQVYIITKAYTHATIDIELLETLAEIIHPGFFVFGLEGSDWLRFDIEA